MFVPPVNVADTRGFSLVEMAIALFIFALVISSILEPAADLYERRKNTAAREYLDTASQAVLDYALRNRTIYRESFDLSRLIMTGLPPRRVFRMADPICPARIPMAMALKTAT